MPYYKMNGKKDGKQRYRVRINYVDAQGKKRQIERVTYGLEEAKQLERELNYSVKQSKPSERLTVEQLCRQYLDAKRFELRETSFSKTQGILGRYIIAPLGRTKIDKLNVRLLQDWKNEIEQTTLGITMKKNIYKEFRAFLNWAVRMEIIATNPLTKVGNFKAPAEYEKEINYYTAEEFLKFIAEARKAAIEDEQKNSLMGWQYYVFFALAFYTGMRKGEIYALQWADIEGNLIKITKSLAQKLKGDDRTTPPKNKSSVRTIQMPAPLIEILAEHRARCAAVEGFSEQSLICGGERAIRDTSVANANIRFANLAGIKHIRIHDFRHSHASLLANEGINIQEVARRLGHSDIKTTWQTYAHLYPREEERAVSILDKIK